VGASFGTKTRAPIAAPSGVGIDSSLTRATSGPGPYISHSIPPSPRAFKVLLVANHLGSDYEFCLCDLTKGAQKTDDYTALNPNQKMPALEDGDLEHAGPEPELSCVAFRVNADGDEATRLMLGRILERGRVHMSSTVLGGKLYVRLCVLCFRSHRNDLDEALKEIESASK